MGHKIFKNEQAKASMENWYDRFAKKSDVPFESRLIVTSRGKSHLLIAGNPKNPPLVCLHAMLTGSAHLLAEISKLAESYYLILPDIPGQSPKGLPERFAYKKNEHAIWLNEILTEMGISSFYLLGISLGGYVAREYAVYKPGSVKKLILIVPAGIVQGNVLAGLAKMMVPMIKYKMNPSKNNLEKLLSNLISEWDDDWGQYMGDSFFDYTVNPKIPPLATEAELSALIMPVLVIAADGDISFPGKPLIDRVQRNIPQVETELLENTRHCPPTTPEFRYWLANRVTDFLE